MVKLRCRGTLGDVPVRVFHGDDSDAFRLLIAETLPDEGGIEVVGGAATADATIAGVQETQPDAVLLDRLGGPELVDAVRAAAPNARIVLLTGYAAESAPGIAQAADAYLVKTAPTSAIAAAVRG
jgi:DNA-binding NarL/FixJ family response regulator